MCVISVSQTSWCLAGSECKMFHPRHSTDLWQGSIRHRPSHTHCNGEGEPGQCLCLIPDIAVAVKAQSGRLWFKKNPFKTVFRFFLLFKSDQLLCRCQIFALVMHSTQDELKPGWALLQKLTTKVKQQFDILLCPFCKGSSTLSRLSWFAINPHVSVYW